MNTAQYIMTASCKQVNLLSWACNQAMRIHIGQLADPITVLNNFLIGYSRHHHGEVCPMEVQERLEELSKLCWHNSNGYNYDETSKDYWQLYQVFKSSESTIGNSQFVITSHQVELLQKACEQAARLRAGQLDYSLVDELMSAYEKSVGEKETQKQSSAVRKKICQTFDYLHTLCWDMPVNADHGMNYDQDSDIWWDMYQVFRYQLSLDCHLTTDNANDWTVARNTPFQTSNEPLVKLTNVSIQ
jgi:hypothetical protein